jgi:5-methylcytosine-specific restriction endonuclease McrA
MRSKSKNRASVATRSRRYYLLNASRIKVVQRLYRSSNPIAMRVKQAKRRATKRAAGGAHGAADIRALFKMQRGACAVCHVKLPDDFHVDHIVPLSLGGSNGKRNLQLLCPCCNLSKGANDPIQFMQSLGRLL